MRKLYATGDLLRVILACNDTRREDVGKDPRQLRRWKRRNSADLRIRAIQREEGGTPYDSALSWNAFRPIADVVRSPISAPRWVLLRYTVRAPRAEFAGEKKLPRKLRRMSSRERVTRESAPLPRVFHLLSRARTHAVNQTNRANTSRVLGRGQGALFAEITSRLCHELTNHRRNASLRSSGAQEESGLE